jgi:hypothetical protein
MVYLSIKEPKILVVLFLAALTIGVPVKPIRTRSPPRKKLCDLLNVVKGGVLAVFAFCRRAF